MKDIRALFAVLGEWKWHYAFAASLLALSSLFRMLGPKVLQVTVDSVAFLLGEGADQTQTADGITTFIYRALPELKMEKLGSILLVLGVIYLLISLLRAGAAFASKVMVASYAESALRNLRKRIFNHLQSLPIAYHRNANTGELIQRSTGDISTIRGFIMDQVVQVVRMLGIFIGAAYLMFLVHPTYALLAMVLVPFIGLSSFFFFQKEMKVWEEHEDEADKLTNVVAENLSGIRVVKAFAREEEEKAKFDERNEAKLAIGLRHMKLHAFFWPFADYLVHMQLTISVVAGGYFVLNNAITLGELTSFYIYALMVTWPMQRIGRILSQMGMSKVAMQRITTILEAEPEVLDGQALTEPIKGKIEFRNVSFAYPSNKETKTIDNVSFTVDTGSQLGIIGPAGGGKSTLIQLLLRFYEPDQGVILIDDQEITEMHKTDLRRRIGTALQNSFLFSTTIEGNISYARSSYEQDDLLSYARSSQIDQVMHIFSEGYQTFVGEKGVSLSGGQKQRIALARALMSQPDVLVLDTATSAVDSETEFEIQTALKKQIAGKTSIVVAHRISSIQNADQIIVLDNGRLVEDGKPEDLAKANGFYAKMLSVQTDLEELIRQDTL